MNISALSIRHPVPAVLLFILLTLFGFIGLDRLGIQQFPDLDQPTVIISASLEGAAPDQLETDVARKIEDKLTSLPLLDHITTTITDGSVRIRVSFDIDKDGNEALNEVRNAVDSATPDLPTDLNTPNVSRVTANNSPLLTYTIHAPDMDEQDLSWFVDNDLTKALMKVKGVASVTRVGGVDREVDVNLNPTLMAGLGISASTISTQLKAMQQNDSGGLGEVGSLRQSLRTLGALTDPTQLAGISIPTGDGRNVTLGQIATIKDTHADRSSLAYRDGKPVIGFQVTRTLGFSDVSVARDVRAAVQTFARDHKTVNIQEVSNTVTPILDNYQGSMHLLFEGALLAILVVWWFLRDWRATLISATALPLSIIPTFAVMYFAGFSLNTISLLALALVIGILVDDSIVEVENIARHLRMGKSPYQAAMEAADEIGLAVIATTFTMVAVFLPTALMSGIPGRIFRQFGVTASAAVLASLLVARLLTPMMAAYFLKATAEHGADSALMTRYLGWIRRSLSHRKTTFALATLFFMVSLTMIPLLPTGFFPPHDDAQSRVTLELPPGSSLAQTSATTRQASALLQKIPQVRHVFANVGTSTSGGGMNSSSSSDITSTTLTVDLVPRNDRDLKQSQVEAIMRQSLKGLAGVRVNVGGGGNGETLDITLAGDDSTVLERTASNLEQELRQTIKGIGSVTSSAAVQRPEIQFHPDYARAAKLGVTSQDIATVMRVATYGGYSSSLPKINLPQRQLDIRVRMDPKLRTNLDAIGQLRVNGSQGQVALASLGTLSLGSSPAQISRLDRNRNITLEVELNGRALGEVMAEARKLPALQHLPASVHLVQQGELQHMTELFSSFGLAMAIGVFCIYAVLVLLFHDFLQPATILSALPLSVGGALFALLISNMSFSMPSVIGLLMLMGIVTKNSILLVEYAIKARREQALPRYDALIDACHKRARPILMTTIAMGAGMLPTALGLGADPSFRQPMAVVVIGGLLTSTVLSLLVVPVIFTYVDDLLNGLKRLLKREQAAVTDSTTHTLNDAPGT